MILIDFKDFVLVYRTENKFKIAWYLPKIVMKEGIVEKYINLSEHLKHLKLKTESKLHKK